MSEDGRSPREDLSKVAMRGLDVAAAMQRLTERIDTAPAMQRLFDNLDVAAAMQRLTERIDTAPAMQRLFDNLDVAAAMQRLTEQIDTAPAMQRLVETIDVESAMQRLARSINTGSAFGELLHSPETASAVHDLLSGLEDPPRVSDAPADENVSGAHDYSALSATDRAALLISLGVILLLAWVQLRLTHPDAAEFAGDVADLAALLIALGLWTYRQMGGKDR